MISLSLPKFFIKTFLVWRSHFTFANFYALFIKLFVVYSKCRLAFVTLFFQHHVLPCTLLHVVNLYDFWMALNLIPCLISHGSPHVCRVRWKSLAEQQDCKNPKRFAWRQSNFHKHVQTRCLSALNSNKWTEIYFIFQAKKN